MIASLEGIIELKGEKILVLNVSGVGYKVFAAADTLQKIPEKGAKVKLWTHQHVREDAVSLYGFLHFSELELFEILIGISGIGPKSALGVLGVAPVDTLRRAIAAGDTSYLTKVSGIGKKMAEKIVLELKEKMAGRGVSLDAPELKSEADALEALMALGYTQRDARDALNMVSPEIMEVGERVRHALKKLGKAR